LKNVPVLSYLLLCGRCRECGVRISPRYALVEVLTGVLFAVAAFEFGISLVLVWALVLISALVALAGIDLGRRTLPNVVVGPVALVGFAFSVLGDPVRWWVYLVLAFGVAAGLLTLALAYPDGMRIGDVKIGGMLGTFVGPCAARSRSFSGRS